MSDDLMEKVARAMHAEYMQRYHPKTVTADGAARRWAMLSSAGKFAWRLRASVALRVVREAMAAPDEAMLDAGGMRTPGSTLDETRRDIPDIWRAMLAASPLGRVE
jgi:hypothetical protein